MTFERLVRFVPKGEDDGKVLLGEPEDGSVDIGAAVRKGEDVRVKVFSGSSVLSPGSPTDKVATIGRLLSPVTAQEAGTVRCIGLNYRTHAEEAKLAIPKIPVLFLKPATAIADPWPTPALIPKHTIPTDSADYEAELAVVLGRDAKNVSEADALDYVLGYTAANDVSSRAAQLAESQWCYSKGFDGSCPLGPVLVSPKLIPDVGDLTIRGLKNGKVVQESGINDLIFTVPQIIAYLSQGTTLPKGTVILTGTPAGIGYFRNPKEVLHEGDEFVVEIQPHVGSLFQVFRNEE
jgi:2-keto-4-pentenoate hydratase/2-oxohepta-3-ene-1,7-dioic acid hydratase in catechol pathway